MKKRQILSNDDCVECVCDDIFDEESCKQTCSHCKITQCKKNFFKKRTNKPTITCDTCRYKDTQKHVRRKEKLKVSHLSCDYQICYTCKVLILWMRNLHNRVHYV